MGKIVTMHQPNYLPWIGFFSRLKLADCFIIVDQVQYNSHGLTNRNKIRIKDGWTYLTIPINRKYDFSIIKDVMLPADRKWQQNHWKAILYNYVKAEYFSLHSDFFEELYRKDFRYLWEINTEIILYLLKCFEIDIDVMKYSEMDVDPDLHKTDMIIELAKASGADVFLAGQGGKSYMDYGKFAKNNIALKFFDFQHPVYQQRFPDFIPNMAAIDLLFNTGTKASEIIKAAGGFEDDAVS